MKSCIPVTELEFGKTAVCMRVTELELVTVIVYMRVIELELCRSLNCYVSLN